MQPSPPLSPPRPQPDSGRITAYRSPGGHGIRLDGAMAAGNIVSRHYDSLVRALRLLGLLGRACCAWFRSSPLNLCCDWAVADGRRAASDAALARRPAGGPFGSLPRSPTVPPLCLLPMLCPRSWSR